MCDVLNLLFEGKTLHDGVPVPDGGLVIGRYPEQKQREVDPTVTVAHEGEQVAALGRAHDAPPPALLSRGHVLLKVSDGEASLVAENVSSTQFVLVKHGGTGDASGQRYELLKPRRQGGSSMGIQAVQWGSKLKSWRRIQSPTPTST